MSVKIVSRFGRSAIALAILALLGFIHDLWVVSTGAVEVESLPFFFPAALLVIAVICVVIHRCFERLSDAQKEELRQGAQADSCLNPANTSRDQGIE